VLISILMRKVGLDMGAIVSAFAAVISGLGLYLQQQHPHHDATTPTAPTHH
jgi:hypothetical protein